VIFNAVTDEIIFCIRVVPNRPVMVSLKESSQVGNRVFHWH